MTYDDNYIDQCGDAYRADTALQVICTFEEFLIRPAYWRERLTSDQLLPAQRAIQQRLDAARRAA